MSDTLWGDALPPELPVVAPSRRLDDRTLLGRKSKVNPCVIVFGAGPDGKQCGTCAHFVRGRHHDAVYFKCRLRGLTHGPGTDHRVRWPACVKYEEVGE